MTTVHAIIFLLNSIVPTPHPVARECAIADAACIESYDANLLTLAVTSRERLMCALTTRPRYCRAAYDLAFTSSQALASHPTQGTR